MPIKNVARTTKASQYYKNVSYETLTAGWLSGAGWEVLIPLVDHGKKTDLVVADDSNYYRIQVKTLETNDEGVMVENMWGEEQVDYVIYFSRDRDWGYIAPAFSSRRKRLNDEQHVRFHQHPKNFLKAFSQI